MNKYIFKVVGTHALIVGGVAAAVTIIADLLRLADPSVVVVTEPAEKPEEK